MARPARAAPGALVVPPLVPPLAAEGADARLLAGLGQRVRAIRRGRTRTMLEVARQAGLSERFVAMIESGRGNPSLLSLTALARALQVDVADLLTRETAAPGAHETPHAARFVALLGLRGAGKSTVGAAAAERLGVAFVELDAMVERDAGLAAAELFELHGASYYRRLERDALDRVLGARGDTIVATTGGLVTDRAAFERVLAGTTAIWLRARPEDHFRRVVEQGDTRPMQDARSDRTAEGGRAMDELRGILRARRALYEQAHHVVDTSRLGLERSVERVVKIARGVLAG